MNSCFFLAPLFRTGAPLVVACVTVKWHLDQLHYSSTLLPVCAEERQLSLPLWDGVSTVWAILVIRVLTAKHWRLMNDWLRLDLLWLQDLPRNTKDSWHQIFWLRRWLMSLRCLEYVCHRRWGDEQQIWSQQLSSACFVWFSHQTCPHIFSFFAWKCWLDDGNTKEFLWISAFL